MNYAKVYSDLIERARKRVLVVGYFEKHHVVPRSIGGEDTKDNIVCLTVKEHKVCHVLLYRLFRDEFPNLIYAVHKFYDDPNPHRVALKRKKPMLAWLRRCKTLMDAKHRQELGRKMAARWNLNPHRNRLVIRNTRDEDD